MYNPFSTRAEFNFTDISNRATHLCTQIIIALNIHINISVFVFTENLPTQQHNCVV